MLFQIAKQIGIARRRTEYLWTAKVQYTNVDVAF